MPDRSNRSFLLHDTVHHEDSRGLQPGGGGEGQPIADAPEELQGRKKAVCRRLGALFALHHHRKHCFPPRVSHLKFGNTAQTHHAEAASLLVVVWLGWFFATKRKKGRSRLTGWNLEAQGPCPCSFAFPQAKHQSTTLCGGGTLNFPARVKDFSQSIRSPVRCSASCCRTSTTPMLSSRRAASQAASSCRDLTSPRHVRIPPSRPKYFLPGLLFVKWKRNEKK